VFRPPLFQAKLEACAEAVYGHRPRVGRMGQLVRIERQSDFRHPLQASTRPTVTAMYGAAVRCKRLSIDLLACGLASMYPASLTGAVAICVGISLAQSPVEREY
jgi:hypothetical protein